MSFSDAFRGFFGFPGPRRPRDPLFGGAAWAEADEDEDEDEEGPSLAQPPPRFGPRSAFEELFRDVGELLALFGGAGAGLPLPSGEQEERLRPPEPAGPSPGGGRPLRDSMLKQPESPAQAWSPFPAPPEAPPAPPGLKADQDLDAQVSATGLGSILRAGEPEPRAYFRSVSVTRVTLPDGAVEERRTVQDSQGRRETTVTRRRGDQASSSSSRSSSEEHGQSKDAREEVLRLDDRELAQFAGTWPPEDNLHPPSVSDPSSVLGSFFRRWFSSW